MSGRAGERACELHGFAEVAHSENSRLHRVVKTELLPKESLAPAGGARIARG